MRAGSYEPGLFDPNGEPNEYGLMPYAFFVGPSGFARGLIGAPGDDFAPAELAPQMDYLYNQERFWLHQYWDLKSDRNSGDSGFYFTGMPGAYQDQTTGYVYYGNSLNVSTTWIVAQATVNKTCTDTFQWNEGCCEHDYDWCASSADSAAFLANQAQLYVDTLGLTPGGKVFVGADFTGHGFVQQEQYIPWIAARMNERVGMWHN